MSIIRPPIILVAWAAVLGVISHPAAAQSDTPSEPTNIRIPLPASTMLLEGTPILLALKQTLRSGAAKKGDPVMLVVAADVFDPGRRIVLVPKGTTARGVVVKSTAGGAFGSPGSLRIRGDYVLLSNGTQVPLRQHEQGYSAAGGNHSGAAIGAGLVVGLASGILAAVATTHVSGSGVSTAPAASSAAFVGSAILVSALWKGGEATLREGHLFEAETAESVPLPTRFPSAAQTTSPGISLQRDSVEGEDK